MGLWRRDDHGLADAVTEAQRPRSCRACGRTFGSLAAWTIHFEAGPGSRCLPDDARGQLVLIDGVLCLPGSGAAGR